MSKLTRRQFIQGLVAAAVAVQLPPTLPAPPAAVATLAKGNSLIPPDQVAAEALRLLQEHLSFRKEYDLCSDKLIYMADYHVPAHQVRIKAPVPPVSTLPPDFPNMEQVHEMVPEIHYQVAVELPYNYRDMITELREELTYAIEKRINRQARADQA